MATTALVTKRERPKTPKWLKRQALATGFRARPHDALPEYLEPAEVEDLLRLAPSPEARLISLIQWRAGLRISEVLALEPRDFQMSGDEPTIRVRHGKGDHARLVPVHPELREALRARLLYVPSAAGPILSYNPSTAWRWLKQALQAVQSEGLLRRRTISTHVFRHSAARHWLASGVPINVVSRWLGHASIHTTLIYLQILPDPVGYMERVP